MQFIVYDFEVFTKDWLIVLKKGEEITVVHNDSNLLQSYYEENKNNIFVGFNNKHYDDYIFKGILSGLDPKRISDWIITKERQGWEFPGIKNYKLNTLDVKQDITYNLTLSLKEAEGNMGISIEESDVPFDLDRNLTDKELREVIEYCTHDVLSTEKILKLRTDDISVRLELLKMFNLPITNIGKTNAKLTATILDARLVDRDDELIYNFPDNLQIKDTKIINLYNQIIDYNNTLETDICGVKHILAYGGLHGAKPGIFEGNIWHIDVSSYYPTQMLKYGYISRNLKDASKYEEVYNLRMMYKAAKDPKEKGLKLVLNTCYGAMKNKYNPLFDPKQANQICITGQLFLIDLLEKLENYIELIQSNTDGIIFISYNDEKVEEILKEWETRTKMKLGRDKVRKIWQKDVNNYIMLNVEPNKKGSYIEVKGGYVKDYEGGKFYSNTTTILDKAVVDYFVYNTPIEKTINECNNLIEFQYICKKGPTYLRVEQDGNILNNCNRVFASKNINLGNLYKVKEDNRKDSIAGLPEHCIVINEDLSTTSFKVENIDKSWYILKAQERINDFLKQE